MWVKICANTCAEDALQAAELGADAVGFVFAPSVRQVTAPQVAAISAVMPASVERVGVFGAATVEEIAAAADEALLTAVQLHGGVDLAFAARLAARLRPGVSIIQTMHWAIDDDRASADRVRAEMAAIAAENRDYRLLVDARVGSSPAGGTGRSFAWGRAQETLGSQPALRVIVAGGLRPDNVAEAIHVLHPWGVDVASGVEREPGRKDFAKVKRFIENARGAASH